MLSAIHIGIPSWLPNSYKPILIPHVETDPNSRKLLSTPTSPALPLRIPTEDHNRLGDIQEVKEVGSWLKVTNHRQYISTRSLRPERACLGASSTETTIGTQPASHSSASNLFSSTLHTLRSLSLYQHIRMVKGARHYVAHQQFSLHTGSTTSMA